MTTENNNLNSHAHDHNAKLLRALIGGGLSSLSLLLLSALSLTTNTIFATPQWLILGMIQLIIDPKYEFMTSLIGIGYAFCIGFISGYLFQRKWAILMLWLGLVALSSLVAIFYLTFWGMF